MRNGKEFIKFTALGFVCGVSIYILIRFFGEYIVKLGIALKLLDDITLDHLLVIPIPFILLFWSLSFNIFHYEGKKLNLALLAFSIGIYFAMFLWLFLFAFAISNWISSGI